MAGYLITSLLSLIPNLLPSIRASVQAPSSSSSNSNNTEGGRARAVEEDLEWLMPTLERTKDTLYDAHKREIREHSVKLWLKELKKVAYDAENVLGEYQYEVKRVHLEERKASEASGSHKRKKMEYIIQIPDDMVDRLKKIRSLFDEIAQHREYLQLRESDGVRRQNNKIVRPQTGHTVDEASVFGRDAEKEEVIDFLLREKEKPFSVISIIGKGGLGKTTIAQIVYKDGRVSKCFDLLGWVCVSEQFDVRRLIKETIKSISDKKHSGVSESTSSKEYSGVSELSSLQEKLAEIVKGKTILLVLDDAWNENLILWESFWVPVKEAKMVRIIMTTRNQKVAEVVQTTSFLRPTNLSEDSCWQLFQHYALNGRSDIMQTDDLVDMGRDITRKCGGLPLAVKSIASLLRYKRDEEGWREILESDLWKKEESKEAIFPALEISYAHLPAHLKPCFLFCSTYRKDYMLNKEKLIELWMSHGYIEQGIREIGVEYYKELKERSFLDDIPYASSKDCKLHDIIHDLARLKSENEHYSVDISQPPGEQEKKILQEAYHVYASNSMEDVKKTLPPNQGLRTLSMDLSCYNELSIWNPPKFEALRVLQLKEDCLTGIPDSISELKHLAFLSITSSDLEMLPSSIGGLLNLQFLYIESKGRSLDYVPHGLVNFPAIKTMEAKLRVKTIGWLKDMTDLEGYLGISGVSNLKDAQCASLKNKCKLEILKLSWTDGFGMADGIEKPKLMLSLIPKVCEDKWAGVDDAAFSWLNSLQPHPNLKELRLVSYPSATVPEWMSDPSSLQSIQVVILENCCKIQSLQFNNLRTLKCLGLNFCNSIRVLQLEQLPSQLEILSIYLCQHLELITGLENLDMLAELSIYFCDALKSITMDGLQMVESTEPIGDSSKEKPLIGRQSISSLTKLTLYACGSLRVLPNELITSVSKTVFGCRWLKTEIPKKSNQATSSSHHTSMSNIEDDVEDEGEDDDSDDDKSN